MINFRIRAYNLLHICIHRVLRTDQNLSKIVILLVPDRIQIQHTSGQPLSRTNSPLPSSLLHSSITSIHARIFCILVLHRKKIHVWTLENFNVIFGPFTRRRSLWRRGNTARSHRLWRRGTCCVGTNGRRGADVVPSSAP